MLKKLSNETFAYLEYLIVHDVLFDARRCFAVSPEVQILITLRYYATGALYIYKLCNIVIL